MAKQVIDIKAGKGITVAQSDEHQRRWTEKGWENAIKKGNYDPTREHLNFEIVKGGKVQPIDKSKSIPKKMADNLKARGIKDPNDRPDLKEPKYRTVVNIILGGSRDMMRELAFGDQNVKWEKGKDNSNVVRRPEIEEWAKDAYKFIADKYGEENIVAFYVHLDETNPHVHCTLLPVAEDKISFKKVMHGETQYAFRENITKLHDEFAEVNKKWKLDRGAPTSVTGAKHRSTEEYRRWLSGQVMDAQDLLVSYREKLNGIWGSLRLAERKSKGLTSMIGNLEVRRAELLSEIEKIGQSAEVDGARAAEIRRQLDEVNSKLADKMEKLAKAREEIDALNSEREKLYGDIAKLKVQNDHLERTAENHEQLAVSYVGAAFFEEAVGEIERIRPHMQSYADRQMLDETVFNDVGESGSSLIICATALFLGMVDTATTIAQGSGGGGSQSDLPWGRDPDEDDRAWARRCVQRARQMMKPRERRRGVGR